MGIMTPYDALKKAREKNLDLVEISPTAQPPRMPHHATTENICISRRKKEAGGEEASDQDRGEGSEVPH